MAIELTSPQQLTWMKIALRHPCRYCNHFAQEHLRIGSVKKSKEYYRKNVAMHTAVRVLHLLHVNGYPQGQVVSLSVDILWKRTCYYVCY